MTESSGTSRRKFITGAGVTLAVAGVATAVPGFASTKSATLRRSVVVSVVDPARGIFNVMWDEQEVQITDVAFANKIASAIA